MKVACIQMVSGVQLQPNLDRAQALLEQAAGMGAELAVLPEYFCLLGHRDTDKLALREPPGSGPIQQRLSDCARSLGMWIVGGTIPLAIEQGSSDDVQNRVHNTSLVFDPRGVCVQRYDKLHLFRFDNGRERFDESRVQLRGQLPVTFDLPSRDGHRWKIGLSVCYDLRFPELFRAMLEREVSVIALPAAFTQRTGQAHWHTLLKARAIENLAYVVAAAQGGEHPGGRRTYGHSLIAGPWGEVLAEAGNGPGVVTATLDVDYLQRLRAQFPALSHRRLATGVAAG